MLRAIVFLLFWSANIFSGKCGDCFANVVLHLAVKLRLVEIVPERESRQKRESMPKREFGESVGAGGVQSTGSIPGQSEDYKRLED